MELVDRDILNAGDEQNGTLLDAAGLTKKFPLSKNIFRKPTGFIHAVDDVSFTLLAGESLGVVGESGCGKTTLGKLLVRLMAPDEGRILFRLPSDAPDVDAPERGPDRHFRAQGQCQEGVPATRPDDFPGPL